MSDTQIHGTEQVQALTITDASISATAAIALTKLAGYASILLANGSVVMTAALNVGSYQINNVAAGTLSTDAVNLGQVESLISAGVDVWSFEGAWSSTTAYTIGQVVTFDNAVYLCIVANTNNEPDTDGGVHWAVVLEAVAGPTGARGALIYTGTGAPTTITGQANNDVYIDVSTGHWYSLIGGTWTLEFTISPAAYTATLPISIASDVISVAVMGASGSSHAAGIVPDPGATAGSTRFLREDATWDVPSGGGGGGGSVFGAAGSGHGAGEVPDPGATAHLQSGLSAPYLLGDDANWHANPPVQIASYSGSITTNNYILLLSVGSSNAAVNLPTAVGNCGQRFLFKVISTSGGIPILTPVSGQKIDNASTWSGLSGTNYFVEIVSDGGDWWIIGFGQV